MTSEKIGSLGLPAPLLILPAPRVPRPWLVGLEARLPEPSNPLSSVPDRRLPRAPDGFFLAGSSGGVCFGFSVFAPLPLADRVELRIFDTNVKKRIEVNGKTAS